MEWKLLLLPDPADFHLPKASAKALPMPTSRKAKEQLKARILHEDKPRKDDMFGDGFTWAEFHLEPVANNRARVDLFKADQTWYYLGKTSTDARAQYTEDPAKPRHNPRGNFLDTLPKPPKPVPAPRGAARPRQPQATVASGHTYSFNHQPGAPSSTPYGQLEKPYAYKPKITAGQQLAPLTYAPQKLAPTAAQASLAPRHHQLNDWGSYPSHMRPTTRLEPTSIPPKRAPSLPANQSHAAEPNLPQTSVGAYPRTVVAQQSRPTLHVHSSVYYRYPFFQVNHNRSISNRQALLLEC